MAFGALIPAAGQGKRMRSSIKKPYLILDDRPVLAHAIELFSGHDNIKEIVVVVNKNEMEYCQDRIINKYFDIPIMLIAGGKTRRESVYAGLKVFSPAIDYVIIHDGVRSLMPAKLVDRIMKAVKKYQAVITGIEVTDTIKEVAEDGFVIDTPARDKLWAIQTPQAFLYEIIMKAHREVPDRLKVTDDASLLEEIGVAVKVIKGSKKNIKITRPLDMVLAERLLQDEESKR